MPGVDTSQMTREEPGVVLDRIEREHRAECPWCTPRDMWRCALVTPRESVRAPALVSPHADGMEDERS